MLLSDSMIELMCSYSTWSVYCETVHVCEDLCAFVAVVCEREMRMRESERVRVWSITCALASMMMPTDFNVYKYIQYAFYIYM
jgi:hypothetical protein